MHLCINELGEFGLSRLVINFLLHFGRVYLMYITSPSIQVRTNQPRWYEITEWYRYSGVQSGCNLVIPHGFVRYPDSNMNPLQKMGKIIWYIDRLDTGKVDLAESKNLVSFHTWSFLLSQIYSYWYLSHANTYFFLRHHVTYFDLPKPIQEGVIIWMCKIQFFFFYFCFTILFLDFRELNYKSLIFQFFQKLSWHR